MTTQIEKAAHELAKRAVERKQMRKEAEGYQLPQEAQTALLGSLLGGAGTGLISSLSGRRGGELGRDLLMGALVGGAGGAAYPFISKTISGLAQKISPDLTLEQEQARIKQTGREAARTGVKTVQRALPTGGAFGKGILSELYGRPNIGMATAPLAGFSLGKLIDRAQKGPTKFQSKWGRRLGATVLPSRRSLIYMLLASGLERVMRYKPELQSTGGTP